MFLEAPVDNMGIYYIIMGTIFIIVFGAWLSFESGAISKAMELMDKENLDKKKK